MEEKILFEKFLFGEENEIGLDDMEFCVDRIVMLPKIRPHQLEKAVRLAIDYCKNVDFRGKLLEKSNECPVLIIQLHKRGILVFEEIAQYFRNEGSILFYCYFRKETKNFYRCFDNNSKFLENENDIDQLIEYGFHPSSIEYCLKYDVIDDLVVFNNLNQEAKWSPFEWSYEPEYLDLLSFAGFFGSIKCFKNLLMKGFEINKNVLSMVVCGGCFDLFHLCKGQQFLTPNLVCKASEFFHLTLLVFMSENGADNNPEFGYYWNALHFAAKNGHLSVVKYLDFQNDEINERDDWVEFLHFIKLLFIMLLKMVILVLLNIFFIKELIFKMELMTKVIFIGLLKMVILVLLNIWLIKKLI